MKCAGENQPESVERDTQYTDEIVCPWCGYKFQYSWDYHDGETDCLGCKRTFDVFIDDAVTLYDDDWWRLVVDRSWLDR